jgi:hypothetical protein
MPGFWNLGITIVLWFLFCADTVERERLVDCNPSPTYVEFRFYFYLMCAAIFLSDPTLSFSEIFTPTNFYDISHLFSCLFLVLSWTMLWVHYHARVALAFAVLSLICACFYFVGFMQTHYLYMLWPLFLTFHAFATFRFAQEHYRTRFGSRRTSRMESPGTRPNADVFMLPTQNPNLLVSETKEEQYQKLAALRAGVQEPEKNKV